LAAGTGTTTEALIEKFGESVEIIAVDQAEEMLKKAEEKLSNYKNIEYIVSQAENLDENITTKVDLVVCNSAFWQMVPKKTLKAVSNILNKGGMFIFNLPDSFFAHNDFKREPRNPVSYDIEKLSDWAEEFSLK
ncbi:MAG: class I SAM-dependent methyltransferase, partial [Candidatus Paceibacterota bacterium]